MQGCNPKRQVHDLRETQFRSGVKTLCQTASIAGMSYGFLFQPFLLAAKLLTNSRFRLFLGSFCAEEYQDIAEYQLISSQCREDFALRDME